jgi:enediyne biosynthesis protein E4
VPEQAVPDPEELAMNANRLRRLLPVLLVTAAVLGVAQATVRPGISAGERSELVAWFGFRQLPANASPAHARTERTVAPGLESIRQWISAVGAAVALTDLRGLGRPADMCLIDPRDDSVTVAPVPGSDGPTFPRFRLTPVGLKYDDTMAPMGCVPVDVNEDGATDLVVYYWGRSPVMFLNTGVPGQVPGAGVFRPVELVDPMQVWNTTALNVGDLDGSGHLSLIIGNYFPDGARVLDPTASDDRRMQMQDGMGMARNAGVNRILQLHPTGQPGEAPRVTDASLALPVDAANSWTLAIGLQDLTDSLLPSIYLANDFGPDQLLVNCSTPGRLCLREVKGARTWSDPKSKVLGRDSFKGMGVTFTYPRGSGLPTILVSNITSEWALQESNLVFRPSGTAADVAAGRLPYRDASEDLGLSRSGWSWDVKAGDFDNSGRDQIIQAEGFIRGTVDKWAQLQELAMGNPELLRFPQTWSKVQRGDELSGADQNCFYVQDRAGRYVDISSDLALEQADVSRGIALGDVNGDGRLDAVVANQWGDSTVLLNTGRSAAAGADLRMVRRTPNGATVAALGATVTVPAQHGLPAQKSQLYYANGHAGVSAADLHLAVAGDAPTLVHVSWRDPTGVRAAEAEVRPGHQTLELREGQVIVR